MTTFYDEVDKLPYHIARKAYCVDYYDEYVEENDYKAFLRRHRVNKDYARVYSRKDLVIFEED